MRWVLENSNSHGFARGEAWSPGINFQVESLQVATLLDSSKQHQSSGASVSVGINGTILAPHPARTKGDSFVNSFQLNDDKLTHIVCVCVRARVCTSEYPCASKYSCFLLINMPLEFIAAHIERLKVDTVKPF